MPLVALVLTSLAGCGEGGGGSSGGSGTPIVAAPTPAPVPTPTPTPAATVVPVPTPTPSPTSFAAGVAATYSALPSIDSCTPGTLQQVVKNDLLVRINAIRALHGLAAVTYNDADDAQAMQAALMMAANNALSHTPPTNWKCYTALGANGAGSSNLYIGGGNGLGFASPDDHLAVWLTEGGSASLGHRRWILYPFLGKVAYGRTTLQLSGTRVDSGVLKVFNFTGGTPAPGLVPAFVALPQGDYPVRYFRTGDYLSFSVAPSSTNNGTDRSVDFSAATISVSAGATNLGVTDISRDNDGYGLANNIQWRVTGLQSNVTYIVTIANVARAPQSSYTYTFRILP